MAKAMLDAPATLPGRLTVARAMENYIEHQKSLGKPVADLISRSNAHIHDSPIAPTLVAELTPEKLRRWLANLAASAAMKRTGWDKKQQYKAAPVTDEEHRRRRSSSNRVWSMVRAGLNLAFKDGKVASDLAWRRVEPFKAVDAARVRWLTVSEAKTGARFGELIRLECQDFNPDSGTIHVQRSKTGEGRHVHLTHEGAEFFAQVCEGRAGSAGMFQRNDGSPWKPSQQARPMAEAVLRAKIEPAITFHGLRHSYASACVEAGVPLMVVAKNLGHSTTTMVQRHYGHLSRDYVADAIRAGAPKFGRVRDTKVVALVPR
jgi:integrase